MPNHVHVVVEPAQSFELSAILKSWKGYSATQAHRLLGLQDAFWQTEYYDHLIRDETDFVHSVSYVLDNPPRAGLTSWPGGWASETALARVARVSRPVEIVP